VKIGNNVFIGMHATILKGVHIGNNVIIGAGSLVNKDIPDNCVAAGNPAQVIMPLDSYYEKRKNVQLEEARVLVQLYRRVYGREPDKQHLSEFFWLFDGEYDVSRFTEPTYEAKMKLVGNYEKSVERYRSSNHLFHSFEDFLTDCSIEK